VGLLTEVNQLVQGVYHHDDPIRNYLFNRGGYYLYSLYLFSLSSIRQGLEGGGCFMTSNNTSNTNANNQTNYTQLSFKGRGFPLTAEEIEQRRAGGKARAAKAGPTGMSEIGKRGYKAALAADPDFHAKGGAATHKAYGYTNYSTGAIGMEAAILDEAYKSKGKRHRYLGPCDCCGRTGKRG
jgi:hypothetical protein